MTINEAKIKLFNGDIENGLLPLIDIIGEINDSEKYAIFNNWLLLGKIKLARFYGMSFFQNNRMAIIELDDLWLRRNYGRIRKK